MSSTDNFHPAAEGRNGKTGQLKVLQPPRDPYDGNEEKKPEYHMNQGYPQPRNEEPDDIQQGEQATGQVPLLYFKGPAERPEAERSDLDQLKTERNPDDGGHHGHSSQEIADSGSQSTEQQPDDVTEEIQRLINWGRPAGSSGWRSVRR